MEAIFSSSSSQLIACVKLTKTTTKPKLKQQTTKQQDIRHFDSSNWAEIGRFFGGYGLYSETLSQDKNKTKKLDIKNKKLDVKEWVRDLTWLSG